MDILLVEDDQRIADFIRRGLQVEGYRVELAANALNALAWLGNRTFDLIIVDWGLPDLDGRELCERVRSKQIDVPILMLTARDAIQDKVEGLHAGADDYMTKPFAFEELLARIAALLRRHHQQVLNPVSEANEIRFADLVLNREAHQVHRGDCRIELTPKEFLLLELFLRMPGKVLSRTRILEQVWGYSSDPLTNVVDVYIRQLRKKIDEDFAVKLIQTVRGFGYKLEIGDSIER